MAWRREKVSDLSIDLNDAGVFRYDRWILRNVTWQVQAGACVAILGPNGGGKSTLARIIAGFLYPSEGVCRILGGEFGKTNIPDLRKRIRLIQAAGPYDVDSDLTVFEAILTGHFNSMALYETPTEEQKSIATEMMTRLGLTRLAEHTYFTLSSGEKMRMLIARALVSKPHILILDEPTAGLDLLAREQVLHGVQSLFDATGHRPTVVMITHHVEELPPATSEILLLTNGQILAKGKPADVLKDETLSQAYGCNVKVRHSKKRWYWEVDGGVTF